MPPLPSCNQTSLLGPYHDGELPPEQAEAMRRHLADCGDCQRTLEGFRRLSAAFATVRNPPLSPRARARIEEALLAPAWVRLILPIARPFAAAAALLLAAGLPVLISTASSATAVGATPALWETALLNDGADSTQLTTQAQLTDWVVTDLSSKP